MTEPSRWLSRFDRWTAELESAPAPRIREELVHKRCPENVLVARVERVSDDAPDSFAVQLLFPTDHPFFFEHPLDHVPGLALIEAGRQTGLVVAHRFYGVPLQGCVFFVNDLAASFTALALLDAPVFGNSIVTDVRMKRGRLVGMTYTGHYLQHGRSIGTLTGTWTVIDEPVLARMRRTVRPG
jgi:hypothetical protein